MPTQRDDATEEVDLHLRIVASSIPRTVITRHSLRLLLLRLSLMPAAVDTWVAGHRCLPKGMTEEVDLHLRIVATSIPRTVITRHCLRLLLLRLSLMPAAVDTWVAGHRCLPRRGKLGWIGTCAKQQL